MYFVQQYGLPWVVFSSNTRGPARAFKALLGSAVVTRVGPNETRRAFFLGGRLTSTQAGSAVTSEYLAHLRARRDLATLPEFEHGHAGSVYVETNMSKSAQRKAGLLDNPYRD